MSRIPRGRTWSRPGRTPTVLRRIGVVVAGALSAGILASFPAQADEPAPAGAPIALGSVTATGDDQLFALAADQSAVYRYNGQGTDWTKVGGPAESLHAGGAGLFATARDTGKVFKYDGSPDAWSHIGEAGADFAVTNDRLYALNPDRTAVYEWSRQGTDWTKIGGPAKDLDAGGAGLFATGLDDKVFKYDETPEAWSQIGEPGADFAVTGDRLYGITPDHSAVYAWNEQSTDWTRVGGPAQTLHAGGAGLFATDPATGTLSRYGGEPDSWSRVGDPAAGFTVSDTHLYGLATGGTNVLRWNDTGTDWTPLGAPTTPAPPPAQETPTPTPPQPQPQDTAPPAPNPQTPPAPQAPETGNNPTAPEDSEESEAAEGPEGGGEPAAGTDGQRDIAPEPAKPATAPDTLNEHAVRMAITAQDDLYTLAADNSALWERGDDGWTPISTPANAVYAGRAGVFKNSPDSKQIRKYHTDPDTGTRRWEPIGEATGRFAVSGKHLYQLTQHGIGKWSGDTWTKIGGPANNIYAGRAGLFATQPGTGDLYRYDGKPDRWTRIGGPGAHFAVGKDHVYGITPDHTAVYEWPGNGTEWTRIGGPARHLYAGGAGLFATNRDTGNIHQYNGTPDNWTEIGGPGATFTVSDTQLYGLSPDLTTTYRWNGTGTDWTRLGGATDIAQQAQDEKLLAANCETGRDCVQEYRDAKELLETSLTDWLKDNGGQILIDTFGVTATLKCVEDHDLSSCLEVAADAGTTLLGIGAVKKSYKIGSSVKQVATKLPKFREKAKQARNTYNLLRKTIDEARKLNDAQGERGQDKTKPQDDSERLRYGNCLKDGKGWRRYGKRDATHGNRATGAYACLNEAFVKRNPGSDVTAKTRPPGYKWAAGYAGYLKLAPRNVINNCHLLGADLGGEGDKLENLATCSRQANFHTSEANGRLPANMYTFEEQVSEAINKDKQTVEYTVEPQYEGPRTVPVSFKMKARGVKKDGSEGLSFEETIPNSVFSLTLKEWRNLGSVTYPDVPIPVGSME
ncbi:tectonin domain-containing protein [Streptomyces microflavus]|uniref:tectonin domain-containing protein n=1 Tax=Streptomyces microflavus TaxID=1919 RepID=UPI003411FB01